MIIRRNNSVNGGLGTTSLLQGNHRNNCGKQRGEEKGIFVPLLEEIWCWIFCGKCNKKCEKIGSPSIPANGHRAEPARAPVFRGDCWGGMFFFVFGKILRAQNSFFSRFVATLRCATFHSWSVRHRIELQLVLSLSLRPYAHDSVPGEQSAHFPRSMRKSLWTKAKKKDDKWPKLH